MRMIWIVLGVLLLVAANGMSETPAPPEGMAYVPAGPFIMGSNAGDADESPRHIATAAAFFIDLYEVSHADFKKFDPAYTYPAGKDNFPAVVTWEQADAYAKWAGKRLPTEEEWEKAARSEDGRIFPWGNSYDPSFIAATDSVARGEAIAKPTSPYGCYDMAGGAYEWTSSWYRPYAGNTVPCEEYGEKNKVMRGGSNFNDVAMMRTTHRYYLPPNTTGNYNTGFRCVKDAGK